MRSTTQFLIIIGEDLGENIPSHFTQRYGKMNPQTERMNMQSWSELITSPEYINEFGGTPKISIEGVECYLVALKLSAIEGDFSYNAAFKYGIEKDAPLGQLCNLEEAQELQKRYPIPETE